MKRFLFLIVSIVFLSATSFAISPFYHLGSKDASINTISEELKTELVKTGYEIIGEYNVGNDKNKLVLVFTNSDFKKLALSYKDRGGLGIAQKIGLIENNGKTKISLLNPDYMFHAYFRDDYAKKAGDIKNQIAKLKAVFKSSGYSFTPFGGSEEIDDLHDYKYMMGMPDFNDPVTLNEYESFDKGVETIRANLKLKKGNTIKVYEIVDEDKKVAVFGVGLMDAENGEKHFLSIIGEDHLAAMPYEIIVQDNKASMLHGRFRFALYWPELTMGTFTKIMSTPGDVEETLELLTK